MLEPYKSEAYSLLRARAGEADAYIAPSHYYAGHMAERLGLPEADVDVVPLGIGVGDFVERDRPPSEAFRVGYLARICPEKGLHNLVGALTLLRRQNEKSIELRVAGWLSKRDEDYLADVRREIQRNGIEDAVSFDFDIDRTAKIDFLHDLDVLSVPTPYHEPKGLFVLEALAAGVPVVQPDHGSFPELIENTGGGLLSPSDSPEDVADTIQSLIDDDALRSRMGCQGRTSVLERYTSQQMAERTLAVYSRMIAC